MALTTDELKWATILALTTVRPAPGPTSIRIIKPPDKQLYNDGDAIDYSGIVVAVYAGEYRWKTKDYPKGILPFNELEFPITTAHVTPPEDQRIWTDGELYCFLFTVHQDSASYHYITSVGGNTWSSQLAEGVQFYITAYNGSLYAALKYPQSRISSGHINCAKNDHTGNTVITSWSYTFTPGAFIKLFTPTQSADNYYVLNAIPVSTRDPLGVAIDDLEPTAFPQELPVLWRGFSDQFTINVYP